MSSTSSIISTSSSEDGHVIVGRVETDIISVSSGSSVVVMQEPPKNRRKLSPILNIIDLTLPLWNTDLIPVIFSYLNEYTLFCLAQTCHTFYNVISSNLLILPYWFSKWYSGGTKYVHKGKKPPLSLFRYRKYWIWRECYLYKFLRGLSKMNIYSNMITKFELTFSFGNTRVLNKLYKILGRQKNIDHFCIDCSGFTKLNHFDWVFLVGSKWRRIRKIKVTRIMTVKQSNDFFKKWSMVDKDFVLPVLKMYGCNIQNDMNDFRVNKLHFYSLKGGFFERDYSGQTNLLPLIVDNKDIEELHFKINGRYNPTFNDINSFVKQKKTTKIHIHKSLINDKYLDCLLKDDSVKELGFINCYFRPKTLQKFTQMANNDLIFVKNIKFVKIGLKLINPFDEYGVIDSDDEFFDELRNEPTGRDLSEMQMMSLAAKLVGFISAINNMNIPCTFDLERSFFQEIDCHGEAEIVLLPILKCVGDLLVEIQNK